MSEVNDGTTRSRRRVKGGLFVVAVLCIAYVASHFYRGSVGVIGPELRRGMGLSAEALGALVLARGRMAPSVRFGRTVGMF